MDEFVSERYVAIDNVCGWPNLTQLRDGTLIATVFNQPCHGTWEGDVECWASTDGGRYWEYRGTPAPHRPGTNRMNVSAGLASNGDLVVLASGWGNTIKTREEIVEARKQPGFVLNRGSVLRPWVSRSSDGGMTWTVNENGFPEAEGEQYIPFGDILPGADGRLRTCGYRRINEGTPNESRQAYFFASDDDGHTWNEPAIIASDNQNETTPLHLGDGRWIVASRTMLGRMLNQYRSEDDGRTWRLDQPLSLPQQHPAHLLRLADGRILLTYGVRNPGAMGIHFRLSTDEGMTWSGPYGLVSWPSADCGYPSTAQNADGSLTTVYYVAGIPQHRRYHVGSVVWQMPVPLK